MAEKYHKKLMLLGGLNYLIPVIEAAHKLGAYVITVDYLPNNIAHKYSDEYHNLSIIDKEAVLKLAQELNIDGIMSFAVDPGVVTAAYVADKMRLPFQGSYDSVRILQDKGLFRQFLKENGFNVPNAKRYDNLETALSDFDYFNWPVIVKPVDSAGSKGVTKVVDHQNLAQAIKYALSESHSGSFIIEDFLKSEGNTSDSDCFTEDGNLICCSFSDQRFDTRAINPYTPSAFSWPSTMPLEVQDELRSELQRLMKLLKMRTGIYNIETRYCKNGKAYIMEVSPRGGGNRLAEMVDIAANAHLIENSVRAALALPLQPIKKIEYSGKLVEIILHADREGIFEDVKIKKDSFFKIIEKDLWVQKGDRVYAFSGANRAIGTLVLELQSQNAIDQLLNNLSNWINIEVQ